MTRKILYLFVFIAINATVAYSQDIMVTPASDTAYIDTSVSYANALVEANIYTKNLTSGMLSMKWVLVANALPHSWTISFCDPKACNSASIFATGDTYTLDSAQKGIFTLEITPDCVSDTGYLTIYAWSPGADSAATAKYLTWEVALATPNCWQTGVSKIEASQVSMYPNPVLNELTVTLPQNPDNGHIDIISLLGSKVYSQPISSREAVYDLTALEAGIYIVRISNGGSIIATRKFTKE